MSLPAENSREEIALVLRAQQGDSAAFAELIERYDRRLHYFVRRLLPDADLALDILQDVWLTLHRRLSGLRAPEAFRVWLYQIAHGRVVDVLRRQRRQEKAQEVLRDGFHEPVAGAEEVQVGRVHRPVQVAAGHQAVHQLAAGLLGHPQLADDLAERRPKI